ncbi:MAG: DUF2270 domain-containing protein [Anaerolineae bacterium]
MPDVNSSAPPFGADSAPPPPPGAPHGPGASHPPGAGPTPEAVWSYRGYNLRASEFTTAMVHYYRAEIQRSNAWRQRLDTTTNWAVITTSAAVTFCFSSISNHYAILVMNMVLLTLFLWIEARRYRYYELWSYRARLIETDLFAAMLVPPFTPHAEWAESLAHSLLVPRFPITTAEAFGRRFRRNYVWLYILVGIALIFKLYLHPIPISSWDGIVQRAAIGDMSGGVVLTAILIFYAIVFAVGFGTVGLHESPGEILPKYEDIPVVGDLFQKGGKPSRRWDLGQIIPRLTRHRQQLLTLVVTDQPQAVADNIMKEMKRGVTALHGKGMYSGQEREVLMVALTVTEINKLKALVGQVDPKAFVIVSPAQEIHGRGFQPLQE